MTSSRRKNVDHTEIALVWIDAQGHEGHILAGAPRLLSTNIPVVAEYWPYGLKRSGGLALFHALVGEHYRCVLDVRASVRSDSLVTVPAADMDRLQSEYGQADFTDLILLK